MNRLINFFDRIIRGITRDFSMYLAFDRKLAGSGSAQTFCVIVHPISSNFVLETSNILQEGLNGQSTRNTNRIDPAFGGIESL